MERVRSKMDFNLTERAKMIQQSAQGFAEKMIAPRAVEIDHTGEFPRDIIDDICNLGYLGCPTPRSMAALALATRAISLLRSKFGEPQRGLNCMSSAKVGHSGSFPDELAVERPYSSKIRKLALALYFRLARNLFMPSGLANSFLQMVECTIYKKLPCGEDNTLSPRLEELI